MRQIKVKVINNDKTDVENTDIVVSANGGKIYTIQDGATVTIPEEIYWALKDAKKIEREYPKDGKNKPVYREVNRVEVIEIGGWEETERRGRPKKVETVPEEAVAEVQ